MNEYSGSGGAGKGGQALSAECPAIAAATSDATGYVLADEGRAAESLIEPPAARVHAAPASSSGNAIPAGSVETQGNLFLAQRTSCKQLRSRQQTSCAREMTACMQRQQ